MKKLLFVVVVGILSTLMGCSNEEPPIQGPQTQEPAVAYEFNDDQLQLLNRLSEINDSLAQGEDADELTRAEVTLLKVVAAADARGFKHGWEYGKSSGKNIFTKFKSGLICATLTSVFYSVCAAITYPLTGVVYFRNPDINTTMIITSNILGTPEGQQRIDAYKMWCEDIDYSATDDELSTAICHNLILADYDEGVVYPSGNVDKVFTEKEQIFYNSYNFKYFHNRIPKFVDGTMSFEETYGISGTEYENAIFNLYINGLNTMTATSTVDLVNKSKVLCSNYHKAIEESNTLTVESESRMHATFYVLPLSLHHWTNCE